MNSVTNSTKILGEVEETETTSHRVYYQRIDTGEKTFFGINLTYEQAVFEANRLPRDEFKILKIVKATRKTISYLYEERVRYLDNQ